MTAKRDEDREQVVGLRQERERLMGENEQVLRENEELRAALVEVQGRLDEQEKLPSLPLSSSSSSSSVKGNNNNDNNDDNNKDKDLVERGTAKDDTDMNLHLSDTTMVDDLCTQLATESARRIACETTVGELMQTLKTMEESRAAALAQTQTQAQAQAQAQSKSEAQTQSQAQAQNQERNQKQSEIDKDAAAAVAAAADAMARANARTAEMEQQLLSHQQQLASIHATHQQQLSELIDANDLRIVAMETQVVGRF